MRCPFRRNVLPNKDNASEHTRTLAVLDTCVSYSCLRPYLCTKTSIQKRRFGTTFAQPSFIHATECFFLHSWSETMAYLYFNSALDGTAAFTNFIELQGAEYGSHGSVIEAGKCQD